MSTMDQILTRTSVREYKDEDIKEEAIRKILEAGMAGPWCCNTRDFAFIVVRNKETLEKMADINGHSADPLRHANVAILACGDLSLSYERAKEYFAIDIAIAMQNMILAAKELNVGSCYIGTWPQEYKVSGQKELFKLPENIIPHSILSLGIPKEEPKLNPKKPSFEEAKVHYERW